MREAHIAAVALVACLACGPGAEAPPAAVESVPEPEMTDMEPQVARLLRDRRSAVVTAPGSPAVWGRYGMALHAHELWAEAATAYRRAEALDPGDVRWPYFLGDVLSVLGDDLDPAIAAFGRAIGLKPGYAPAHMRLGRVLVAAGRDAEAAAELERALELAPDLEPARVTLAQARLALGELAVAAEMLEGVLADNPRHEQALSTLSQVYMRQGRRDEARRVAERVAGAASYNLFEDPVMQQVVAEGASSAQLWERAKSFLDNGDYEQGARGLERVVALKPDDPEVHHQLAVAYGHLGDGDRSRIHLERTLEIDPQRVDPRVKLAILHIDSGNAGAAVPLLEQALALAPDDPDAGWLLGRARLAGGETAAALGAFEAAAAGGRPVPLWAHVEWGTALAGAGQPVEAMAHFQAVLASDSDHAQANFYAGLLLEGLGRLEEAVRHYCRSALALPGSPAAGRLAGLGASCSGA